MAIMTVGVLGCGLMGSGIAQVSAAAGLKTIVRETNQALLDKGLAYWDYATAEETDAERKEHDARVKAKSATGPYIYSRRWMAETDADRKRFEAEGRKPAVKVRMPREGVCRFFDHVRGDVEVEWAGEQDIVVQRSDGGVTYNLANVVDDFDMRITHVIRAAAIVPLALITLSRALAGRFDRHRRIARWTLPIWLYVSVTGVVIYLMLYQS